jgi:uncharacterized protein with HEPN domain
MVRSAIVQKLAVIGEAASRVSGELQARYDNVPWALVVEFRNVPVHAYFGIDTAIVWRAASVEAPILREQIAAIIQTEFPR